MRTHYLSACFRSRAPRSVTRVLRAQAVTNDDTIYVFGGLSNDDNGNAVVSGCACGVQEALSIST